jgi:hypothetical protein
MNPAESRLPGRHGRIVYGANMKSDLKVERLRELFDYNPNTGVFHWRVSHGSMRPGREAGTWNRHGYRVITINKMAYGAHRLAWLFVYGEHPTQDIDHINGKRDDNRIANLRQRPARETAWNRATHNLTGFKGVTRRGSRYEARFRTNGKEASLGTYGTAKEAGAAFRGAFRMEYGELPRTTSPRRKASKPSRRSRAPRRPVLMDPTHPLEGQGQDG